MQKIKFRFLALFLALALTLTLASEAHGTTFEVPDDCFYSQDYCSFATIKRNGEGSKFIEVKFYAQVKNDFEKKEALVQRFISFQKWVMYTQGAEHINLVSSGLLRSANHNGKRELSQYARYFIKAPWPVSEIEVVERTTYREYLFDPILDVYWTLHSDRDFAHKGIKRKDGTIKVKHQAPSDVYHIEVVLEIEPTTALLSAARKPIQNAMAELFLGMFDLK